MESDFKLAAGVHVSCLSGITEGYAVNQTDQGYAIITVNVSADRLERTFLSLAELVNTPGFAVVEIPTSEQEERALRKEDTDPLHRDVYYLDGIGFDQFESLFVENARLFVDDGLVTFGFGSHGGHDEVFVGKYKIVTIFADDPDKYTETLDSLGYEQNEDLKTIWDNITPDTPGSAEIITVAGKTVYDLVEDMLHEGLYLAERREEP